MGSTVVHVRPGDPHAGSLALAAGLAVHEAVVGLLPAPHHAVLKWPNDLLIDGAKLAGILLERTGDAVVAGIGVNLAQAPDIADRATCALADFMPAPDPAEFAQTLARCFTDQIALWRSFGLSSLIQRWQSAAHPIGTPLTVSDAGVHPVCGAFAGLNDAGALRLTLADGTTRLVHAGDVSLTR